MEWKPAIVSVSMGLGFFELWNAIWAMKYPANGKYILLALLKHWSPDSSNCWPSLSLLSDHTQLNRSTVVRVLDRLERDGIITVDRQFKGGSKERQANRYAIQAQKVIELGLAATKGRRTVQPPDVGAKCNHVGARRNRGRRTVQPQVGAQCAGNCPSELTNELTNELSNSASDETFTLEAAQSSQLETKTTSPDSKLLEALNGWNALPDGIGRPCKADPIAKKVLECWRRTDRDPELRACFDDIPALMSAIERSTYCHRKGWFKFTWLLTQCPKTKDWRAESILAGAYVDSKETVRNGRERTTERFRGALYNPPDE